MENREPHRSDAIEWVVAVLILACLGYPVLSYMKHKIDAKVAADVSVADSLKRIADAIPKPKEPEINPEFTVEDQIGGELERREKARRW